MGAKPDMVYLAHMLECIGRVQTYCADGEAAFRSSRLIQDAVVRNLQTMAESRSLPDLGSAGCKSAAAVHFSPASCPIAGLWGGESGKNWPRWGRFSLSASQARQAPGQRLSATTKALAPTVPWRAISGFRNIIVHDYLGLDVDLIWRVVADDLPVLNQGLLQATASLSTKPN